MEWRKGRRAGNVEDRRTYAHKQTDRVLAKGSMPGQWWEDENGDIYWQEGEKWRDPARMSVSPVVEAIHKTSQLGYATQPDWDRNGNFIDDREEDLPPGHQLRQSVRKQRVPRK